MRFPVKIDPNRMGNLIQESYLEFVRRVRKAAYRGVDKAAKHVYRGSLPLVPVDTGALKASGRVEGMDESEALGTNRIERVVAYGQGKKVQPTRNAPTGIVYYAIKVHEDLEGNSSGPKFLERPANSTQSQQAKLIREELKKVTAARR